MTMAVQANKANAANKDAESRDNETQSVPDTVECGWADAGESSVGTMMEPVSYGNDRIEVGVSTTKRYNFLVAGGSGLGKTTFSTNALKRYFPNVVVKELSVEGPTMHIEERGRCEKNQGSTKIIISIVDTPGYGDRMDNSDRVEHVLTYVEAQNQKYEEKELYRFPNHQEQDSRIHCCFYFIMPSRVAPLDIEFMLRLQSKVPIVPIVAKADTLERNELDDQLFEIHQSLVKNSIEIFDFKEDNIDSSWLEHFHLVEQRASYPAASSDLSSLVPSPKAGTHQTPNVRRQIPNVFAVISGQREYHWGTACENNPLHSDTPRLHEVLFKNRSLQSLGRLQDRANVIHDQWRCVEEERKEESERARVEEEESEKRRKAKEQRVKALRILAELLVLAAAIIFACTRGATLFEQLTFFGVIEVPDLALIVFFSFVLWWKVSSWRTKKTSLKMKETA